MARFVKLTEAKVWTDPSKDTEIWVNPDFVQCVSSDPALNVVELVMQGKFMKARGKLDEIVEKLSSGNRRII